MPAIGQHNNRLLPPVYHDRGREATQNNPAGGSRLGAERRERQREFRSV